MERCLAKDRPDDGMLDVGCQVSGGSCEMRITDMMSGPDFVDDPSLLSASVAHVCCSCPFSGTAGGVQAV